MAFITGTKVLTTNGWKNIEDIGGKDRLLIRNFLGDAQFSQPFAVKKKNYSGKIIAGGCKSYQFKVTPGHEIVYTNKNDTILRTTAEKVPTRRENSLKHRSRYSTDGYLKQQKIRNGDFDHPVDTLDWYMLVGYVLRKGLIETNRERLILSTDRKNPKKDMDLICPVLDRMGLVWNYTEPFIVVSRKSNVANKLALMLGSRARKKMYIPNKMIYNSTIEQGSALIETFIKASREDGSGVDGTVQFSTTNIKFLKSLEILGLLSGYTVSSILAKPAGTKVPAGQTKKDSYAVYVRKSVNEVSIIWKKKEDYDGKVYEIDIFEDQLLIKGEGSLPIWMKPK